MPKGIFRPGRRLVLGNVLLEKLSGSELNRFPLLLAGFVLDDLAVAFSNRSRWRRSAAMACCLFAVPVEPRRRRPSRMNS